MILFIILDLELEGMLICEIQVMWFLNRELCVLLPVLD
jgi:hypothetical protein